MTKTEQLFLEIFIWVLALIGVFLVTLVSWKATLGVFLMMWSNNLSNKSRV